MSRSVVSDSLQPHGLQAPLSMGFSRVAMPSSRDRPSLGMEARSPALQEESLLSDPPGKPQ